MKIERLSGAALAGQPDFDDHEAVYRVHDDASGLNAIIALHSTTLGPAAGGCRYWSYRNQETALTDALRLSKSMSYKNAMAGLPLGGGKSVIWTDRMDVDRTALFTAFGRALDTLAGKYVTAEDVGTTVSDMVIVSQQTPYVCGLPPKHGQPGGDPSPKTAHGVFLGIGMAMKAKFGVSELRGGTVAIQGLGSVGYHLCKELYEAGAKLIVADLDEGRTRKVANAFSAQIVPTDVILTQNADVFAPCALGGVLTAESIASLKTGIVAGAANNQLSSEEIGELMRLRGILYAPDYVINAGGIIQVAAEYLGRSEADVEAQIRTIPMSLQQIFEESNWRHLSTNKVANAIAQAKLGGTTPLKTAV